MILTHKKYTLVNHKMMKHILYVLIIPLFLSCSVQDDCNPNYYCKQFPYDNGYLNIDLTNNNNDSILIILYHGYLEDDEVISQVYTQTNKYSFYLSAGERYAVEVYYNDGAITTIALDGGRLGQETTTNCDETCYEEPNLNLNLRKL